MLRQAKALRQLLKSNTLKLPDEGVKSLSSLLQEGIKGTKADGDPVNVGPEPEFPPTLPLSEIPVDLSQKDAANDKVDAEDGIPEPLPAAEGPEAAELLSPPPAKRAKTAESNNLLVPVDTLQTSSTPKAPATAPPTRYSAPPHGRGRPGPQFQSNHRQFTPQSFPQRISAVGMMGVVAAGPTRFQRASFRGFSDATTTAGGNAPAKKQHDDDFRLDSKFVSALLAPAPTPLAAAPAATAVQLTAAQLEEAQRKLLQRKRQERDAGPAGHSTLGPTSSGSADLSSAEWALLDDLLRRDDRLYDVVEALREKQLQREAELNADRDRLIGSHNRRLDEMHRLNAMRLANAPQVPSRQEWVRKKNERELRDLEGQLSEEMRRMTTHIVKETDLLTREQQKMLQSVGVPGFFATTDAAQVALQSKILNKIADGRAYSGSFCLEQP